MKFTIFGGGGFVGGKLASHLKHRGHEVFIPLRSAVDAMGQNLGHVVYAIGMTSNFRGRPFQTVDAHVCVLSRLLQRTQYESWLYLSSTRLYGAVPSVSSAHEDMGILLAPHADGLYDSSKFLGEALCLSQPSNKVRVARLSNVYGLGQSQQTFLASVIDELLTSGQATIKESPTSAKDYISISEVVFLLEQIALCGNSRVYNVASGNNISHAVLAEKLSLLTGLSVNFAEDSPTRNFPHIDISRIANEFEFRSISLLTQLQGMLIDKN